MPSKEYKKPHPWKVTLEGFKENQKLNNKRSYNKKIFTTWAKSREEAWDRANLIASKLNKANKTVKYVVHAVSLKPLK